MPRTVYTFKGFHGCDGRCGMEFIQLQGGRLLIVCTELPDNPGTSITNMVAQLATRACHAFGIDPALLIWVEHYEQGVRAQPSYDLVTFKLQRPASDAGGWRFIQPNWRPMLAADWHELGLEPRGAGVGQ